MSVHGALHPTITLLQTSSLSSLVQVELERMILSGELAPGSKLTEVALAARLGVSRGPLREAFRMLEEAGLVRTEKNRGVFVRDIPIDEAVKIFDLRTAMDELAGRKLIKELSLFRRLNLADGWLLPISANEHRQILKAIASGDADAAGRAMFDH